MNPARIFIIFKKELIDILRDRRTLLSMIVVPIVAIPLLMWVANQFVSRGLEGLKTTASKIAVIGEDEAGEMMELVNLLDEAATDPSVLATLEDSLLAQALNFMMQPDEAFDAMLASQQSEDKDAFGDAKFIDMTSFVANSEAVGALLSRPSFLADPVRTRLLASKFRLETQEAGGKGELDLALLSDQQRLRSMNEQALAEVDRQMETFRALKTEIESGINAGTYDAVVVFHRNFKTALAQEGTARYTVIYDESSDKSSIAQRKLSGFFNRLGDGLVRARVSERRLVDTLLSPMTSQEVAVGKKRNFLAIFLPYIVLLMCFAGAVYPAIDLAAGEKERGTLETLLVTPAARSELVMGKFLVVSLTAVVAAMLNIGSLAIASKTGLLSFADGASFKLEPQAVALSIFLLVPVATFFAAVLLATSIFARSYKEAQSYVVPFNMAIILPALSSMIPGIELDPKLSLVPLVNVALALKEAWSGIFQWDCIAIILVSSVAYAALALFFCTKWFQREEVLFRS